jgi:hypothetical protein
MGYLDGLTSVYFKTAEGGRKLFFPWGILGRGYVVESESDYAQLRHRIKAYKIVTLVLIIGSPSLVSYYAVFSIALVLTAFYVAWMLILLRKLRRSDERLSLQESTAMQARAHGAIVLWLAEVGAIVFVGLGVFIWIVDPGQWVVALAAILFFGLCAAKITRMLVLQRQDTVTRR